MWRDHMDSYREKGSYYDVPADSINLEVKGGMDDESYNPNRYMEKQRKFAKESQSKLKKEKYDDSRYCGY